MCHKQENLQHWLTDEKARDQFVIRTGSDTEVFWNDARHLKPDPVYKRAVSFFFSFPKWLVSFFSSLRNCTDYGK
jgi:translation initiation factor 3 subunit B